MRARAPVLRRRGAADAAPPPPAGAAVRRLGGPQRLARARAQPPGRDLHRDPRRHRRRRQRRPRRRRHRPHCSRDARRRDARTSSSRTSAPASVERAGEQGSAAKWAHAAMALAVRALGRGERDRRARPGSGPADGRARDDGGRRPQRRHRRRPRPRGRPSPAARLARCGRPAPERARPARAPPIRRLLPRRPLPPRAPRPRAQARGGGRRRARSPGRRRLDRRRGAGLFDGLRRGDPVRARGRLPRPREGQARPRATASRCASRSSPTAIGGMHGVTHTLDEIRERGVPGFEVEVVGTDANVDRRLSAVAEVDIPFYAGLKVGVPSLPAIVEALAEGRYDLVHLCSPGPGRRGRRGDRPRHGAAGRRLLPHRARRLRGAARGRRRARRRPSTCDRRLLRQCDVVLSPVGRVRRASARDGHRRERIGRWDRGVDIERFSPDAARRATPDGRVRVLYAGRLTREKGADLLADAFLAARARDPRLQLVPGRRRPRGGRAARAARRAPRRSSAGSRATSWRAPTRAPTSSSSLADGHLRPGAARGAGQRAAGRRGGRGRPGGADRVRPHRRPVPAARERDRRRRRRPRGVARGPRAARPRRPGRCPRAPLGIVAGRARRRLAARVFPATRGGSATA